MFLIIIFLIIGLIAYRQSVATRKPIKGSGMRLLLPSFFLLSGFTMMLNPKLHFTSYEFFVSLAIGIVFSIPLVLTTNFEIRKDSKIYVKPSKGFYISLAVLFIFRLVIGGYIQGIPPFTLGFLSFLVAFFYVLIWRSFMFKKYRQILS